MKLNHWLSSTVSRIRTSTSRRRHARRLPAGWQAPSGSAYVTAHSTEALEERLLLTDVVPRLKEFESVLPLGRLHDPSMVVSGDFAYVVDRGLHQLQVIDVSDPASPAVVGAVELVDLTTPSLVVSGGFAYVVDSQAKQLQVIDLNDPGMPEVAGSMPLDTQMTSPRVAVSGGFAYIVDSRFSDQVQVIDVRDPDNLQNVHNLMLDEWNGADVFASGDTVYVVANVSVPSEMNPNSVTSGVEVYVIDASTPENATVVSTVEIEGSSTSAALAESGDFVYVYGFDHMTGAEVLRVLDVTTPDSPVVSGTLAVRVTLLETMTVSDNVVYLGSRHALHAVDVSTPTSPRLAGTFDVRAGRGLAVSNGIAYLSGYSGLQLLDVSQPPGGFVSLGEVNNASVVVADTLTYVVDNSDRLQVIDVSDPDRPDVIADLALGDLNAPDLAVSGDFVYVVDDEDRLQVVDVSTPDSPHVESTLPLDRLLSPVIAVESNVAYVVSHGADLLQVIDVTNPGNPEVSGAVYLGDLLNPSLAVAGGFAYVVDERVDQLQVIDVRTPDSPAVSTTLPLGDASNPSIAISGSFAYVVDANQDQLQVFDISMPGSPSVVSTTRLGKLNRFSMTIVGDSVYVVEEGQQELLVIDVSTPASPRLAGAFDVGAVDLDVNSSPPFDHVRALAVSGDSAYLVDSALNTLRVVDVSRPAGGAVLLGNMVDPSVAVAGTAAYVVDGDLDQLRVIDVSSPDNPTVSGTVDLGDLFAPRLAVSGTSVYVVDTFVRQLQVIDVSTPDNPTVSGTVGLGTAVLPTVAVSGNYAYVVSMRSDELRVFDVSDPESPNLATTVSLGRSLGRQPEIEVSGNLLHVLTDQPQLHIFDISSPGNPVEQGTAAFAGIDASLAASEGRVYVSAQGTTQVIDVGTPASPVVLGSITTSPASSPLTSALGVTDELAYLAVPGSTELQVIDFSVPDSPRVAGTIDIGILSSRQIFRATGEGLLAMSDGLGYVVDSFRERLQVFSLSLTPPLPEVGLSLSANAGSEADRTVITATATADMAVDGDQTVAVDILLQNGVTADDFDVVSGTITIPDGDTTGSIDFTIQDDALPEGTETATIELSNPSAGVVLGAATSATVAITDNDAVISDFVWNDANEDGIQDAGETGRDGVTVNLLNAAGDTQLDSTTTANGGLYSFLVEPGTYIVEFVSPVGTFFSPRDAGTPNDDTLDSDADGATGRTAQITVAAGDIDDTVDAGLITDDVTPIVSINQRTTTDDTPGLSGNVDDPTADVDVTVDGTTYDATNHGDGTWTLADDAVAALDPGVHNIVVTATDAARNVGTDSTANELSIAVRAFDFGAAGSPVAAGFTQVLTSDVIPASPSANDFGWVDNTGLQDRDRSTVASDLDRDYHKTNSLSSTFQAVVPNGEYHVTFVIGSGADPRTNVFVAIEGTELPGSITTTPGTFHTRTELVDITDGLLDFELIRKPQTATSAGINGIILLPATLEPRLDATDALQFHRLGAGPVPVDDQFTLDDPDDTNLTGAEVRITAGFMANEDVLAFSDQNGITGSYDGATGVLTLSGTATVAHYQTALRSVTFDSTGTTTGGRGLQFAASDGTTGTGYDSRSLTVLPAGGAGFKFDFNADGSPTEPGFIPVGVTQAFSSGAGFGWLSDAYASNLDARDRSDGPDDLRRDYHKISSGSMTFAVDLPDGTYDVTFTIGSQRDTRNGVAVSLENARVPNATTTFATLAGQFLTETHRVTVSDGRLEVKLERQGSTGISINGLEVTEVGGAPSIDLSAGSAVFESGAGAIVIDDGLTIDDIDSTDLTGATVRIVDGLNNAADSLLFSDQNGITGGYDANLGILSLTGTTTLANYRTALRSVQFDTTDNTGTRTVQFEVDDGAEVGADTRDIFVTTPFSGTARYDFGSATSPVEGGYTGIHEGSAFDPALGYGWLSTANLASRVRNSPVPLDERRDYVRIGSGSMTFAVSLPNGDYDVQLTIGSSENARNNVGVILEGTQVDTISTAVNQFATPTHRVTVNDNRLEVRIERQGSSGASINALVITEVTP